MSGTRVNDWVDAFLAHHFTCRPVDATFMGFRSHDSKLPPAGAGTLAEEAEAIQRMLRGLEDCAPPATSGERLDLRLLRAELLLAESSLAHWPRFANPAWFTGEAAFGLISLLLPQSQPMRHEAFLARLRAIPDFLADGRARLDGVPTPKAWVTRAQREAAAMAAFLRGDLRLHEDWRTDWAQVCEPAAGAFEAFAAALAVSPDRAGGCGETHLATIMREVHGLREAPSDAAARARRRFDELGAELNEMARRLDPARPAAEQIAALANRHAASAGEIPDRFRHWHARCVEAGRPLVTPATDYQLDYRLLSPCFRQVAKSLYFLSYRCPPGADAGAGSVYWINAAEADEAAYLRAHSEITVKTTHAAHHGSIGHHTQNHAARAAAARLARLGGTDCALGVAFLSSGTMIEGWACYVTDLLKEAESFYASEELVALKQSERRNVASILVDIHLHMGDWTPEQAVAFYRDEAGFPAARVENEVTRNWMLPGSRLMYATGVDAIWAMRARSRGDARSFHDKLLSYGHAPLAFIADEMEREGLFA